MSEVEINPPSRGKRPSFTPPPPPRRSRSNSFGTDATVDILPLQSGSSQDNLVAAVDTANEEGNIQSQVDDEVDAENENNSLQESDGEEDHENETLEAGAEFLSAQENNSINYPNVNNSGATKSVHRNIDSQRAKNTLNQYESDGEYETDNYDEMFSRRSSGLRPSFISPSTPLAIASDGSLKVCDSTSQTARNGTPSFSVNSYGMRVPKIKRGIIELQAPSMFRQWKKRYFHLERGSVIYFEPLHWFQEGEFDLAEMEIASELKPADDVEVTVRLQSAKFPDISFKCHSHASKLRWMRALQVHIQYAIQLKAAVKNRTRGGRSSTVVIDDETQASQKVQPKRPSIVTISIVATADDSTQGSSDSPMNSVKLQNASSQILEVMPIFKPVRDKNGIPTVHTGWLHKRGQWFPTIRHRFFMLFDGVLSYYKKEWDVMQYVHLVREEEKAGVPSAQKKFHPPRAKGKFAITHYEFRSDFEHGRVEITLFPGLASPSRRVLVVYCSDFMERDSWLRHFHAHAVYVKSA
jgi:hypothetical protein